MATRKLDKALRSSPAAAANLGEALVPRGTGNATSAAPGEKKTKKRVATTTPTARVESPAVTSSTPLSPDQVARAVDALARHVREFRRKQQQDNQVRKRAVPLPMGEDDGAEDDAVFVSFGFKLAPEAGLKTFKGKPISLPHPWRADTTPLEVCLLVKDKEEAKKWLGGDEGCARAGISKIISLPQLRTRYTTFQQKRELADRFDVFLADDRIVCMLPKTLGKTFYSTNKAPLQVRMAMRGAEAAGAMEQRIRKVLNSTFFYQTGSCSTVRVGMVNQPVAHLVDNVIAVANAVATKTAGGWKGVQTVHVKTAKSAALPVFESLERELPVAPAAPQSEEVKEETKTRKEKRARVEERE